MGCLLWWRFSASGAVVAKKGRSELRTLDRNGFVRVMVAAQREEANCDWGLGVEQLQQLFWLFAESTGQLTLTAVPSFSRLSVRAVLRRFALLLSFVVVLCCRTFVVARVVACSCAPV
jgi:hypothetical protein